MRRVTDPYGCFEMEDSTIVHYYTSKYDSKFLWKESPRPGMVPRGALLVTIVYLILG